MFFRSSKDILLDHLAQVERAVALKQKNDANNAKLLRVELEKFAKRHSALSRLRLIVFVLLYASILSAFSVPILSDVVQTLVTITGVVGVGILSLLALYLSYRMRELWNKMLIVYSHLIAIYEKNNKGQYMLNDMPAWFSAKP